MKRSRLLKWVLVDNPKFQASINAPRPNQGYMYLDWTASQGILERQLLILKLLEIAGKPFFSNLRSLTTSSYGSETGLVKGGVFFRLNAWLDGQHQTRVIIVSLVRLPVGLKDCFVSSLIKYKVKFCLTWVSSCVIYPSC